jgi:hypothetical protein
MALTLKSYLEVPMHTRLAAALMTATGLLIAVPAFAQTAPSQGQTTAPKKQPTQYAPCGATYNANPTADSNCRQQTQSLVPSATQGAAGSK